MNKSIFRGIITVTVASVLACVILILVVSEDPVKLIVRGWWQFLIVLLGVVLLSYAVSKKLTSEISHRINEFNAQSPDIEKLYPELEPFVIYMEERNRDTQIKIDQLNVEHKKQDEMRRDFTANVSHELKTPLTSISGYAEIMKNGLVKQEDVSRFAGKIYDESGRLIDLVHDILKLSQLDGYDISEEMTDIDLYDMCGSVISELELSAQSRRVTFSLGGERVSIKGPRKIAKEIIFNICDNAVKYNKDGGRVDVTLRQCVDGVELSVADTGIGIPEEDMAHIFERFYRVDKSHSKEIGGTGLGLSIVKHGVMYMNANLSIKSELGKGTVIRVLF